LFQSRTERPTDPVDPGSVGHVMQTRNLWEYLHAKMDKTKAAPLADSRVQPLQVLDISDYENLLGLVQAGESLPGLLAHKSNGLYRERDFAAWLHSPGAPSDKPRLSVLEARWEEMTDRLVHEGAGASGTANVSTATRDEPAIESDT
jgi:hypothetical protein